MFHCRLTAPGWENFSGNFGFGAQFIDGLSVNPLDRRQIMRIGSSTVLVNADTGDQVGPSVIHWDTQSSEMPVPVPLLNQEQVDASEDAERDRLAAAEREQREVDARALVQAQVKAQAAVDAQVVYTRQELEAIGSNDGIQGLREIATPLGVKGRGIAELVTEVLDAQNKLAAS